MNQNELNNSIAVASMKLASIQPALNNTYPDMNKKAYYAKYLAEYFAEYLADSFSRIPLFNIRTDMIEDFGTNVKCFIFF